MRICFVNAFRRFSRIPPVPECVFAKSCRSQQASAFGVEIHHDTFFLSSIRDKFKTILFIHPVDLESPSFIRLFHCQTASASIGELHVHKVFQICRPDIVLCSHWKFLLFFTAVCFHHRHRKLPRGYQRRLVLLRVADIDFVYTSFSATGIPLSPTWNFR